MANVKAVATGNWSDTATWDGGVLPTAADDVYTNNFNVTIDQNVTVLSLRNTAATGITAGGRFFFTNGVTVNATGTGLVSLSTLIEFNLASPNSATVNCTLYQATGQTVGISISGTGTFNFNGDWRTPAPGASSYTPFLISANATVNIIGNCLFYVTSFASSINITAVSAILNWTGSMPANLSASGAGGFLSGGTSTLNLTGTYYSASGTVGISSNGICNITGTLEPVGAASAVFSGAVGSTLTLNGIVKSNSNRAFAISSSGLVTISGQVICVNEGFPISASRLRLANALTTQVTFQTDVVATNKTLYEPGVNLGNPVEADVRNGVTYASGALTGTLVVPTADTVTKGVVYDNGTIGTAENTSATFLAELATSTDPLAERLRNVTTVQVTGNQIAAAFP